MDIHQKRLQTPTTPAQVLNPVASALLDSQVLVIPRDELLWLMGQKPDLAMRVTKLVGLRRRRIENRLRNIMFRPNRDRILLLLAELLESHGQQVGEHWEIRLRLSHQELASLIGATRETVTVTLGQLQLERLIRIERRLIKVLDRNRLIAEANGAPIAVADMGSRVPAPKSAAARRGPLELK